MTPNPPTVAPTPIPAAAPVDNRFFSTDEDDGPMFDGDVDGASETEAGRPTPVGD
jgi:hypothetical protein